MRPKTKGNFRDYIRNIEGLPGREYLPNGFYVGERVYYEVGPIKYYGTVTKDLPHYHSSLPSVLEYYKKSEVVWCVWDHTGDIWYNYVKDTFHEKR